VVDEIQRDRRERLIAAAVAADRAVWQFGGVASLQQRNQAVREAVAAGCGPEEMAQALGVKPQDVQRWVTPSAI
jgi:FixJ family two-component response regulator